MFTFIVYDIAVLAFCLCYIKCFISYFKKLFQAASILRIFCNSPGSRNRYLFISKSPLDILGDGFQNKPKLLFWFYIFKQYHELITAPPAESAGHTSCIQITADYLRYPGQYFITEHMPISIIYSLEIIYINNRQIQSFMGILTVPYSFYCILIDCTLIEQSCSRIVCTFRQIIAFPFLCTFQRSDNAHW